MKGHFLTSTKINMFRKYLQEEEKSGNTLEKYIRDVTAFFKFCTGAITKDTVIAYKQSLIDSGYTVCSINSMLAGINSLFSFLGWYELRVKSLKVQQQVFRSEEKELTKAEYERLCHTAEKKHNERLTHPEKRCAMSKAARRSVETTYSINLPTLWKKIFEEVSDQIKVMPHVNPQMLRNALMIYNDFIAEGIEKRGEKPMAFMHVPSHGPEAWQCQEALLQAYKNGDGGIVYAVKYILEWIKAKLRKNKD